MLFANGISVRVLKANVASAVCTMHSRDFVVMVKTSFGLTFTNVSGATEALVCYFEWF